MRDAGLQPTAVRSTVTKAKTEFVFQLRRRAVKAIWELGATYAVHLRLIRSVVGDFLLVIIELFSLGAFVLSQFTL